ncbi:Ig-like domain-containing protein [Pseudomonas xanthosomatis]|uniref:Ig-like domain-containing protein n=1 Tax=Pseudomonas xanthosomatis TaxID=2842356 RepID=UPI001C3CF651|nr:Ig-like domain-containing protein [Pseudomonas xanthosomatis]QXH44397.1 Ig-like domain-containing protein [Pseudomonas xanthosomatis]
MPEHNDCTPSTPLQRILETEPGTQPAPDGQRSLLALQRKPLQALMDSYPSVQMDEAKRLKARLDVGAAAMMRAFREQRLKVQGRRPGDETKGPLALSNGPTFENQFSPSWGDNTHPQAVDATTSPAAYLVDMLMFASEHVEALGDPNKTLTLRNRRPDLFELSLDEQTMNREVSQVEVVNHVLAHAIGSESHQAADSRMALEDTLLQVFTPLRQFPYEAHWQQIRTVLAHNKLGLSDVSRLSDLDSPYFIQPGAHSQWSDTALQQDASLGPGLRALLTEAPYFGTPGVLRYNPQSRRLTGLPQTAAEDDAGFFMRYFGVPAFPSLQNVVNFCQAVQLSQLEMEALFGLAACAPRRSENALESAMSGPVSPGLFGARFINSGGPEPVSVANDAGDPLLHQFRFLSEARCDRVQRLMRLALALQLPFQQADQVVCASIDAERLGAVDEQGKPLQMTANTIRALGLFQYLRERFACSAEDFAALLSDMSVFAVGDTLSHFDRVFNRGVATALVLDGQWFDIAGEDAQSKLTVDLLCSGLGINLETFRYLARSVMQGQGQARLRRSLATISAFYRVTLLARLLKVSTIELLSLLEVLSPQGQFALQLTGTPHNAMYRSYAQADTVSVVHAVCQCVLWCQQQSLPIAWLVQQLLPVSNADVVPEAVVTLFSELKRDLLPYLDLERALEQAGVTPLKSTRWHDHLSQIVDAHGLVTDTGHTEEDLDPKLYENFAEREIDVVIARLESSDEQPDNELPAMPQDLRERLKALVLGVILRMRLEQWGVVQARLSQMLSLQASHVVPVIFWADGKVHGLLEAAVGFEPVQHQSVAMKNMTTLLQRMERCAEVVSRFALSPALLSSMLTSAEQPRFSLRSTELTLHTLYYLERYTHCLRLAKQPEEHLLGYFTRLAALGEMTPNEQRLVRDAAAQKIASWLGWGVREVLDVAGYVAADGIIRNLAQLCVLVDTRELCEHTGLSAASLMKLSKLSEHSSTQAHRDAAQEMLSSLERAVQQAPQDGELRQSLSSRCLVSQARLIARKAGEACTVTLTLLDMNSQPVAGIRVAWATTLGTLLDHYSYTDEQGVASVQLQAGRQVGVANVSATYLLDSQAFAPPVVIDCDEDSLMLLPVEGKPREPWQLAGNKGFYSFAARLQDKYDNLGVDRLVHWVSQIGEFAGTDGQTLTDSEGYSRIDLRSLQPGQGQVRVWYAGGTANPELFTVGFDDLPYASALLLTSQAVVGEPIVVQATILGLDGALVAGQALAWACTGAALGDHDQQSDAQGVASATLDATQAGTVSVTVTLVSAAAPEGYFSKVLTFDVVADARLHDSRASLHWPLADGISASEYEVHIFSSAGQPVARYPITWAVQGQQLEPVLRQTGPDGIARFLLKSESAGEQTVTASWGEGQSCTFAPVKFLPPLELQVLFDGQPLEGPLVIAQPASETVQHTLTYRLAADHPLLAEPMQLLYSGRNSAPSLGLVFDPPPGADNPFKDREVAWTITCKPSGLRQEAALQLGLTHEHAMAPYWTDAVVNPPRD